MLSRALINSKALLHRASLTTQTNMLARNMLVSRRAFSAQVATMQDEEKEVESPEARNQRLGVDTKFDAQKHGYVLTFPWNFAEIIERYEAQANSQNTGMMNWNTWIRRSGSDVDFNNLFREFHQFCAMPEPKGINRVCEPRLAEAVNKSIERIHFHGLDVEMANLTVHQPNIKVIKAEIKHGLDVDRDSNGQKGDWNSSDSTFMFTPITYYTPANDTRSVFDNFEPNRKPYLIQITALIESPMKLFVQNQNYSEVLFGSNDQEHIKNVVRFEANVYWTDFFKVMTEDNKRSLKWKITDFNNLMNENPHF